MAQQIWIRPRLCGKKCLDPAGAGSKFRIPLKATYVYLLFRRRKSNAAYCRRGDNPLHTVRKEIHISAI